MCLASLNAASLLTERGPSLVRSGHERHDAPELAASLVPHTCCGRGRSALRSLNTYSRATGQASGLRQVLLNTCVAYRPKSGGVFSAIVMAGVTQRSEEHTSELQ